MIRLYRRISEVLLILEQRFHKDLRRKRADRLFRVEIDLLGAKILGLTLFLAILRFLIVLFGDLDEGHRVFAEYRHHAHSVESVSEYRSYRGRVRLFTATTGFVIVFTSAISGLALNLVTGVYKSAEAATFGWTQTNWNSLTSNTTGHPAPADWTQYSATTTNIANGATIKLTTTALTQVVDTTDTNFSQGSTSSVRVSGSAALGKIELDVSSLNWTSATSGICAPRGRATYMGFSTTTYPYFLTKFSCAAGPDIVRCSNASCSTYSAISISPTSNDIDQGDFYLDANGFPLVFGIDNSTGRVQALHCTNYLCSTYVFSTNLITASALSGFQGIVGSDGYGRMVFWESPGGRIGVLTCLNLDCSSVSTSFLTAAATTTINNSVGIGLGSDGYPRVSWLAGDNKIRYVRCLNTNCTSTSSVSYITVPSVTGVIGFGAGRNYVMKMGSDGAPRFIAAFNTGAPYADKFIRCTDSDCGTYVITNVSASSTARYLSDIQFGSNGFAQFIRKANGLFSAEHIKCLDHDCVSRATTTITTTGGGLVPPYPAYAPSFGINQNGYGYIDSYDQSLTRNEIYREVPTYYSSGTFTSRAIDMGFIPPSWGNLTWTQGGSGTITMKARSDADGDFSNASAWGSCSNISNGGSITGGGCATNGHRYIQYQASLSTADTTQTPTLDDVTVGYNGYASAQTITSSAFDSGASENLMGGVLWTEDATLPAGTLTSVSVRTASTSGNLSSAAWTEVSATSTGCSKAGQIVTCTSAALPAGMRDGVDDRWFQYRLRLSSNGESTPTVEDVTIRYVYNAAPSLQNITASQQSDGTVSISYEAKDADSTTGSVTPGFINPSFEYSTDNGSSWTPITLGLPADATSTKAVSESSWTPYTLTWDARTMLSGIYSTTTKIRITANDNEAASNVTQLATLALSLDLKPPTLGGVPIKINGHVNPALITLSATDDNPISMKLSRLSTLSDASWVSYLGTTTISLVSEPDTVYVLFKDSFENITATSSATTPATPANAIVRDLSNITASPNENRLFIAWGVITAPGPGFAYYRVARSTDGNTYSSYSNIPVRTTNYVIDDNSSSWLDPSTTYSYKLYSEDTNGNTSYYSAIVTDKPDGQGGTDLTVPTITNVQSTTTSQTATLSWATDELADSLVGYCIAPCASYGSTQGVSSFVTSHEVTLSGLSPGTTYNFAVYSDDPSGNAASSTGYSFTTASGAQISGVAISRASNSSADIVWTTDIPASSYVVYATNTPPVGGTESIVGLASLDTSHAVTLSGLVSGQTYYFYVRSQDVGGNWSSDERIVGGVKEYYSFSTTNDATPPAISTITVTNIWDDSATVVWSTDELADSYVEWSANSGYYASSSLRTTYDMAHYIELTGLTPSQTYYYRVRSTDGSGNTATSTEQVFTTLEEQIGVSQRVVQQTVVSGGGGGTVIIGVAKEEYEKVKAELAQKAEQLTKTIAELSTIKNDVLGIGDGEDLSPKELLRIVSERFGELTGLYSSEAKLGITEEDIAPAAKTLRELAESVPPPIVLGKPEIIVTPQKTTIIWETDKETNAVVAFAREDQYQPSADDPYAQQVGNFEDYQKSHRVELPDLAPSTLYHFQIRSYTPLGAIVKTRDYTFRTTVQMPEIFDSRLLEKTERSAKIAWRTNVLANSTVRLTPMRGGVPDEKSGRLVGKPSFVREHEVVVAELEPATAYQVELLSADQFGNTARSDLTSIFTGEDNIAPAISQVKTDVTIFPGAEQKIQSIVQWATDEPATSQVFYEEVAGTTTAAAPKHFSPKQSELSLMHTVVLSGWKPNTIYRIRTVSIDGSGNTAYSKDYTIRTPAKKASIIDVIVSNFTSTFGWTKNIGF